MAERSVLVKLQAQVGDYVANMGRAEKATEQLANTQDKAGSKATESGQRHEDAARRIGSSSETAEKSSRKLGETLEDVARKAKDVELAGQAMVGFGTVTVAALGATAKAAMDWESAWAGVTKTVDGTPEQLAEVEAGLRDLARTLPATHQEIAAVAEAAGQLGVKREDIVGFTKTMIDLGETTNLTADEAATMIAQISNVMGTMERDGAAGVARFGSALVALGNDGASTEKDILSMAQRIAGAAATVGASEDEVLALSNALASMGVRAELGGGVTTRVLLKMFSAVKSGGEDMQKWADVAGVSAEQFGEAFADSPVKALDMVSQGLAKTNAEGGNVVSMLSDLGLKGTEETQVMLALAASGSLLGDSLKLGAEAIQDTSALLEEANKRYETTESKVKIAWNNIKDAAIEAGAVILPVIASLAEGVADLAGWFADLPAPVQGVITVLGGVAGVASLAVGGFILLFPRVMDTYNSFKKLQGVSSGAASGLLKVGKAASVAGAIAAVGLALAKVVEADYMKDIDTGMGRVADAFADVQTKGPGAADALDRIFQDRNNEEIIRGVDGMGDALDRMLNKSGGEKFNDWAEGIIGGITTVEGSSHILKGSFDRMDQGLSDLVSSGKADEAAEIFAQATQWARDNGVEVSKVAELFPQYADALSQASAEQKLAADGAEGVADGLQGAGDAAAAAAPLTEEAAEALEEVGLAADGTVVSLGKYLESLFAAGLAVMDTREASFEWQNTLRDMGAEIEALMAQQGALGTVLNETGTDFNLATDAGLEANKMFQGIAREGLNVASVMANDVNVSQEQVQGQLRSTYDALMTAATGMGVSEDAAIALTREVLQIPDNVDIDTWLDQEAERRADALTGKLNGLDGKVVNTYVNINETTTRKEIIMTERNETVRPGQVGRFAGGGRLPRRSTGGRLPTSGPGTDRTDGIMGVSSEGTPIAWVDAGEWVINGRSSAKHDSLLRAINEDRLPANLFSGTTYSATPSYTGSSVAPGGSGEMRFTGDLVLDSGEFLGKVRGIARAEADGTVKSLDNAIVRIGRGGKYAGGM
ncbi:MAG: phage tail tape measure protein [Eubacteriales bacterium]